jgi:hypothetical protein
MATIKYDVRLAAQANKNSCWNASAQMIWWYWQGQTGRAGPMNTLYERFANVQPIVPPHDFIALAKTVGLIPVPFTHPLTGDSLYGLLKNHGPLWCAGFWYGPGHIIVLTGTDGSTVYVNDPDGGVAKTGSLSWFNSKLSASVKDCIMCKDPERY